MILKQQKKNISLRRKKNVDYDTPTFLDVKRLIYIVIIIYKASKKSIN